MPASFFKVTSDSIALPLLIIFNFSLQSGIIPYIWKHTFVVPVFKKRHLVIHAIIVLFRLLALLVNLWKVVPFWPFSWSIKSLMLVSMVL